MEIIISTYTLFLGWLGKISFGSRLKTAPKTDERIKLLNEIISGIRVIKMYTWEKPFSYLVQRARKYVSLITDEFLIYELLTF